MPICDLPDELLSHILDYAPLGLSDVVRASHVSRRWRGVAHAHETFCRNISFEYNGDMTHESEICARLCKQVECSQGPLHLTIRYFGQERAVLQTIVSVLNDHMHRVVSLSVSFTAKKTSFLYAALNRPAPQLKWLRAQVFGRHLATGAYKQQVSHIPQAIFDGQSVLEKLIVTNVQFPRDPSIIVQSIKHLALHNYLTDPSKVSAAVAACPNLRQLDIAVQWGRAPPAGTGVDAEFLQGVMHIPTVRQLHHLHLMMPLHIHASYAHVLPHLAGPLQVAVSDPSLGHEIPHEFDLTLTSQSTGRVRQLARHGISDLAKISRHISAPFAARIVELAVWVKLLYIPGEIFPALPSLETFTIHLHAEHYFEAIYKPQPRICAVNPDEYNPTVHEMPSCPSLGKVVVCGIGQSCPAAWLERVILGTLFPGSQTLELELRGVTLVGDPDVIHDIFSSISSRA